MTTRSPIAIVLDHRIAAGRAARSEKARPVADAIHATLGRGVGPADLAHRLAIVTEDAGMFRSRSARIDAVASLLEQAAAALRSEAAERRTRDAA
jgi:hypothetical protein